MMQLFLMLQQEKHHGMRREMKLIQSQCQESNELVIMHLKDVINLQQLISNQQ